MTQVNQSPNKGQRKSGGPNRDLVENPSKTTISGSRAALGQGNANAGRTGSNLGSRASGGKKDANKSGSLHQGQSKNGDDASDDESKYLEIDLEDAYEDDDLTIYFDKASLLAHVVHLEDDNLFKIHLVQEDEQNLERLKRQAESDFSKMEEQIEAVQKNIDVLSVQKQELTSK